MRTAVSPDADEPVARRRNGADVLALGPRPTSGPLPTEILDAWSAAEPGADAEDRESVTHVTLFDAARPAP